MGIRFLTPEEYFLEEEPKPFVRDFDPGKYLNKDLLNSNDASKYSYLQPSSTQRVRLTC